MRRRQTGKQVKIVVVGRRRQHTRPRSATAAGRLRKRRQLIRQGLLCTWRRIGRASGGRHTRCRAARVST